MSSSRTSIKPQFSVGSLLDKNIRLELDNPLFKKLQDAIEHPCRHKDWFGMAEQAINTVYALAERPDIFCDKLIKNFIRRAFGSKPPKERAASTPMQSAGPLTGTAATTLCESVVVTGAV